MNPEFLMTVLKIYLLDPNPAFSHKLLRAKSGSLSASFPQWMQSASIALESFGLFYERESFMAFPYGLFKLYDRL